jgi:hypothetical protein
MKNRRFFLAAAGAAVTSAVATAASAQSASEKPIRLLVGFAPGGAVDSVARLLAVQLSEILGQSVVVENRPGAGGNVGTAFAAKAKNDGYTLLVNADSAQVINPALYAKTGFDPVKDFDPIAPLAKDHDFKVRICGPINANDAYNRELLERIARYPWAESVGKVSRDELTMELAKSSVLALVSHEDNCPMTILEAMSAGIPILASNVGGIPDLVDDGINGHLCDPAEPVSIREGLQRILSDPAHATALGKAGKDRALERYLPVAVAKRHLEIYREVLAKKRKH